MWRATGTAIAHAPNLEDLRNFATRGDNIVFDSNGHSARVNPASGTTREFVFREQQEQANFKPPLVLPESGRHPCTKPTPNTRRESAEETANTKVSWMTTTRLGLRAVGRFIWTPTGSFITIYGLNIVAWGAMLFFLLIKAAPAMNHPDDGNADSSPRKIWIEIDSQILNALFCLTSFGLAPWRIRDLWWCASWRAGWGPEDGREALKKLAKRNDDWFRMGARPGEEYLEEERVTFTSKHAPPTQPWKLDLVVWMMILNTLFQVGMAFMMWHYNRIDRPTWGSGLFIGLGCGVSMLAGIVSWWEGRKIKIVEGPKVLADSLESADKV